MATSGKSQVCPCVSWPRRLQLFVQGNLGFSKKEGASWELQQRLRLLLDLLYSHNPGKGSLSGEKAEARLREDSRVETGGESEPRTWMCDLNILSTTLYHIYNFR